MPDENIALETLKNNPKLMREVVVNVKEKAEKISKFERKFSTDLRKIIEECDKIIDWIPDPPPEKTATGEPDLVSFYQLESIQKRFNQLKTNLFYMYWTLARYDLADGMPDADAPTVSEFWEKHCKVFDVRVAVKGQLLLVKLPPLWGRYTAMLSNGGRAYPTDSLKWMDWELRSALAEIQEQIPLYLKKNICYIHVLPEGVSCFVDNDNYDTKHITDIITSYLLGTDNAMICSFSFYSMRAGELPESTYVVVSPDLNEPPALKALVPILNREFSL